MLETTTHTTSRKGGDQKLPNQPRRFAPQLVEDEAETHKTSRRGRREAQKGEAGQQEPPAARRFAPNLVDSVQRSRKAGDTVSVLKHSDKTDVSPGDRVQLPRHVELGIDDPSEGSGLPESRFSAENLSKKLPRQRSFRAPSLDPITSTEDSGDEEDDSRGSKIPSLSTSTSAGSDDAEPRGAAAKETGNPDNRFSGYLLALAARAAEKELEEQALSAFPNQETHEPVDHFAGDRDSDDSMDDRPPQRRHFPAEPDVLHRRESALGWSMGELRKHKQYLDQQREHQKSIYLRSSGDAPGPPGAGAAAAAAAKAPFGGKFEAAALQGGPMQPDHPRHAIGGAVQEAGELKRMRHAARPPLLGKDLQFPRCPSPKHTRLDPTQRPRARGEDGEPAPASRRASGLWAPAAAAAAPSEEPAPAPQPRAASPVGLWNGVCHASTARPPSSPGTRVPSGLLTPAPEPADDAPPAAAASTSRHASAAQALLQPRPKAPTPRAHLSPCAQAVVEGAQAALAAEAAIAAEFPDAFVTQVYNYLSLGHPALGRAFDAELGRIARVDVAALRADDALPPRRRLYYDGAAWGGAPDQPRPPEAAEDAAAAAGGEGEGEAPERCARWRALKSYIWEWARQQPRMEAAAAAGKGKGQDWGVYARKGSWAI